MTNKLGVFHWKMLMFTLLLGIGGTLAYGEVLLNDAGKDARFVMLNSDSYIQRNRAWFELLELVHNTQTPEVMLKKVQNALKNPANSFDAQERLENLEEVLFLRLKNEEQRTEITVEKTEKHVNLQEETISWKGLLSDSPKVRKQTEREIETLIQAGNGLYEIQRILRGYILDEEISADDRLRIWKLEREAREKWLKGGEKEWKEFQIGETQLKECVKVLANADLSEDRLIMWMNFEERVRIAFSITPFEDPFGGDGFPLLNFEDVKTGKHDGLKVWERMLFLEDALLCPETTNLTRQFVDEFLKSETTTPSGMILLKRLQFLTVPCMAAEFWRDGKLCCSQILQIGVPQQCDLGISFFDSSTEESAHCQQGTNLKTCDYSWNTAIPHPSPCQKNCFFHLVPLKTPEAKLLYASRIVENPEERFRLISEKTLQQVTLTSIPEEEEVIRLLSLLEPHTASRYAGDWLKNPQMKKSYTAICEFLCEKGTNDAIPALLESLECEAIWTQKFPEMKVRIDWMAALCIAERDPWEGMEEWLIKSEKRNETIVENCDFSTDSPMIFNREKANLNENFNMRKKCVENIPTLEASVVAVRRIRGGESLDGLEEVQDGLYRWGK